MGRHAYIITANGNLSVISACLRMIDDSRNDIFILFDKKAEISDSVKSKLKQEPLFSHVCILPDKKINWGGASQINAELRLLEEVVNNENALSEPYTFIHYLQGADLPLKSQEYIHSFFDAKEGQQFVSFSTGSTQELRDRSQYRHFLADTPWFRYNKVIKAINKGFVAVQKGLGIKRNTDIRLFYGSALWSITSSFAHYLVLRRNEIKKRFRVSLAADEVFIQTILMDSPFKKEIAKEGNLRLINWQLPHPKNSPHTWEKKDWPLLRASSAEVIFARKFNETVDMEIVKLVEAFVTDSGI